MQGMANKGDLERFGYQATNPKIAAETQPPKPTAYQPPVKWLQEGESFDGRIVFADFVWQPQWQRWRLEVEFLCSATEKLRTNRTSYLNQMFQRFGSQFQSWVGQQVCFREGQLTDTA